MGEGKELDNVEAVPAGVLQNASSDEIQNPFYGVEETRALIGRALKGEDLSAA